MTTKKQNKFMTVALDKMFKQVGLDKYDPEFTKQQNWYLQHEWTPEQEGEFKSWMITEYQRQFNCTLYTANKHVSFFLLSYGWKTKEKSDASSQS
jgi:hypothetical protein